MFLRILDVKLHISYGKAAMRGRLYQKKRTFVGTL